MEKRTQVLFNIPLKNSKPNFQDFVVESQFETLVLSQSHLPHLLKTHNYRCPIIQGHSEDPKYICINT